jgi:hypothetical protein
MASKMNFIELIKVTIFEMDTETDGEVTEP